MPIRPDVLFGILAEDIDEANAAVEKATGLSAEARESSFWGGEYFVLGSEDAVVMVISNRDIHDDEPVVNGADEWEFVAIVELRSDGSGVIASLEGDKERFARVGDGAEPSQENTST